MCFYAVVSVTQCVSLCASVCLRASVCRCGLYHYLCYCICVIVCVIVYNVSSEMEESSSYLKSILVIRLVCRQPKIYFLFSKCWILSSIIVEIVRLVIICNSFWEKIKVCKTKSVFVFCIHNFQFLTASQYSQYLRLFRRFLNLSVQLPKRFVYITDRVEIVSYRWV